MLNRPLQNLCNVWPLQNLCNVRPLSQTSCKLNSVKVLGHAQAYVFLGLPNSLQQGLNFSLRGKAFLLILSSLIVCSFSGWMWQLLFWYLLLLDLRSSLLFLLVINDFLIWKILYIHFLPAQMTDEVLYILIRPWLIYPIFYYAIKNI